MSESTNCPTCGSAVRVVGHTTLHYEPMPDPRDAALALVRELAGRNPLVSDDTFAACGLCRREAGGSEHDPHDFPHAPDCLWVAARALADQADAERAGQPVQSISHAGPWPDARLSVRQVDTIFALVQTARSMRNALLSFGPMTAEEAAVMAGALDIALHAFAHWASGPDAHVADDAMTGGRRHAARGAGRVSGPTLAEIVVWSRKIARTLTITKHLTIQRALDGLEAEIERLTTENADLRERLERAAAALTEVLDAADRQRQGGPLPYEEWRLRMDEGRNAVDAVSGAERCLSR